MLLKLRKKKSSKYTFSFIVSYNKVWFITLLAAWISKHKVVNFWKQTTAKYPESFVSLNIFVSVHLCCAVNVFPPEHAVVQGHGCVVVDELQNLQTCHLRRLQDGPALCLVEEGWDGDHCVFDRLFCEFRRLARNRRKMNEFGREILNGPHYDTCLPADWPAKSWASPQE